MVCADGPPRIVRRIPGNVSLGGGCEVWFRDTFPGTLRWNRWAVVRATIETMASKGKPSPRSAVSPLSDEQVKRLAARHTLVDST